MAKKFSIFEEKSQHKINKSSTKCKQGKSKETYLSHLQWDKL